MTDPVTNHGLPVLNSSDRGLYARSPDPQVLRDWDDAYARQIGSQEGTRSEENLRREDLETRLTQSGLDPVAASDIASKAQELRAANPELTWDDALIQAGADHLGMSRDEFELRADAFALSRGETSLILRDHFDEIAGDDELIVLADLHKVISDENAPRELRAAAYRVAADAHLFDSLDAARQTSVEEGLNGINFDDSKFDEKISATDLEQFPAKDHQLRTVGPWKVMLDTARQEYDVSRANGHISANDVNAFLADNNIPPHVRQAVWDLYSDTDKAGSLVQPTDFVLAEGSAFDRINRNLVSPPVLAPPVPVAPPVAAPPVGTPPGGGGGGGYAAALLVAFVVGWKAGEVVGGEIANGPDTFVLIDPQTGKATRQDVALLEQYRPEELAGVVGYMIANGEPPPPDHELSVSVPGNVYVDPNGAWRYHADGELYDGYDKAPSERPRGVGHGEFREATRSDVWSREELLRDGDIFLQSDEGYWVYVLPNGDGTNSVLINTGPESTNPRQVTMISAMTDAEIDRKIENDFWTERG